MKSIKQVLAEQPFFDGIGEDILEALAGCGQNVHFRPAERLFGADEPADRFFILTRGRVALEVHDSTGRVAIVDTVEAGALVGLAWMVPPHRWTTDAVAIDSVSAVALDATCLRGKCDADPRVGYLLMQRVASTTHDRLASARVRLLDLYGVRGGD